MLDFSSLGLAVAALAGRKSLAGEVDGVPMRQLYRVAAKAGLNDNVNAWMDFHKARIETAHTHNREVAQVVFDMALAFLRQAQQVLGKLENRND